MTPTALRSNPIMQTLMLAALLTGCNKANPEKTKAAQTTTAAAAPNSTSELTPEQLRQLEAEGIDTETYRILKSVALQFQNTSTPGPAIR